VWGTLAHIRAIPSSAALNRKLVEKKLEMPLLAIGAQLSFGKYMAEEARRFAHNVSGAIAERSGHRIPEERPGWLSEQLLAFFGAERLKGKQVCLRKFRREEFRYNSVRLRREKEWAFWLLSDAR
jgi:hypothetical protein